jgi:hypothetical protein
MALMLFHREFWVVIMPPVAMPLQLREASGARLIVRETSGGRPA